MTKKLVPLFLMLFYFYPLAVHAQDFRFSGDFNLQGMASTGEELPFWMYNNQRGRISETTNYGGWITGKAFFDFGKGGSLEAGAGILYQDAITDMILFDEIYATYKYHWLEVTAGRKQRPELYDRLSASNESILWSLNARPLPGIQIETAHPVFFSSNGGLGFEGSWNEYLLEEERFMREARVHHKNFRLVFRSRGFEIKAGLQHFVQWSGTSQSGENQPDVLNDYFRVITGQGGGENANNGDQLNALGNHLGGYEIYFTKFFPSFKAEVFYNHLFEDKSGMRLGNTPDGRYGLFIDRLEEQQWIDSFMYEFYYTKHQSNTTSGNHIWDNYFNNFLYRSGWTYEGRVIGAPFFVPNSYNDGRGGFVKIGNNKFVSHHLGVSGTAFAKLPYHFLGSYRRNYGHHRIAGDYVWDYYPPDDPRGKDIIPAEVVSTLLELGIPMPAVNLKLSLGADFSTEETNFGIGVNLQKRF